MHGNPAKTRQSGPTLRRHDHALDPLALFRLDGKVAVVTGASSGLGDRFARVLDAVGARVVIAARRADRLEALAAELTDARRRARRPRRCRRTASAS